MTTLPRTDAEEKRLIQLRGMRAARVDGVGKPKPGFKTNVAAIDEEIARIEAKPSRLANLRHA